MPKIKPDVLQGTLDLMVLQTLETMGPLHGWGIARRIEQVSNDALFLNQGTISGALFLGYPISSLHNFRKPEPESRSLPWRAFEADRSALSVDSTMHNNQTESKTTILSGL